MMETTIIFVLYILKSSKTGKYYIGHTKDLARRINEHNSGQSSSTKSGSPWEVIFTQEFFSRSEAAKIEFKLKAMKSRKFIEDYIRKYS